MSQDILSLQISEEFTYDELVERLEKLENRQAKLLAVAMLAVAAATVVYTGLAAYCSVQLWRSYKCKAANNGGDGTDDEQ